MDNQQLSSEFQNFKDGNYMYPKNLVKIPSLFRDHQIYVLNQMSQNTLIKGDEDKPLYYWLKNLDDGRFQKLRHQFWVLRDEVSNFKKSFDYLVTSYCDVQLDDFIISSCSDDDGIVEDDFKFHLSNKVDSIIKKFIYQNEPKTSEFYQLIFPKQ